MCLACRQMKTKDELIRVVKSKQNEISIDISGKLQGRGTYICKSSACIESAKKTKRFERALKAADLDGFYEKLLVKI